MRQPEEARAIYKKLRTIAKEKETFTISSCYRCFGLGKHYSSDWQECIDKLIAKGELEKADGGYRLRRNK